MIDQLNYKLGAARKAVADQTQKKNDPAHQVFSPIEAALLFWVWNKRDNGVPAP